MNLSALRRMANASLVRHGVSFSCPQHLFEGLSKKGPCFGFEMPRRRFSISATFTSFANENREFVIVGGDNSAGYDAREFVEHGIADGRLCIISKEAVAPYERPALTKGYLFPLDKKPAWLPGFHTCVGSGGERQTPEWYKDHGIEVLYEDAVTGLDVKSETLTTATGKVLKYGSLITATGCTAARLPEKVGGNLPGVHYIRDVADTDRLASSLIVFPEDHLMPRLFTPSLAQRYENLYQANGVKLMKRKSISKLEDGSSGRVASVKLDDGSTVDADTEFELLPKLARAQPVISKSRLESAPSVEAA